MGGLGLVFILATAGFIAWNERMTLFEEARQHAEQSAYFLADHAQRLFEVADIALSAAHGLTGQDWATIEASAEIKANMRRLDDMLPFVDTLWLADATGRVRVTTLPNPPPTTRSTSGRLFRTPGPLAIVSSWVARSSARCRTSRPSWWRAAWKKRMGSSAASSRPRST